MSFSLLQELSGSLLQRLENVTETQFLSALNALSAIPAHPYDQIKYKYFGPDYEFPTFKELPDPVDFNPRTALAELTSIGETMEQTISQSLTCVPGNTNREVITYDSELIKKNIIFSEVVKTVKLHELMANPVATSHKLLNYYTKLFGSN
jgi:hypothetical protein